MYLNRVKSIIALLLTLVPYVPAQYVPPVGMADFPKSWVDPAICDPPGGTWEINNILGAGDPAHGIPADPLTVAGWQTAVNRWDGTKWYHLVVPAGTQLHGAANNVSADGVKALVSLPVRNGVSKCLVVDADNPSPLHVNVCGHGLPNYGGTRTPGCANDTPTHTFSLIADSADTPGNYVLYYPVGSNHVVVKHPELTIAPNSVQSVNGAPGNIAQAYGMFGSYEGLEYAYYHGWNPGDPGQPVAACSGWTFTGKVNTANTDGTHGLVTWVTNLVGSKETSRRFGMPFSDGTHSSVMVDGVEQGWPQASIEIPAGSGILYPITNHDPVATDQALTVLGQPGTQTGVLYTMTNPMPKYSHGCGDDMRGGQLNADNSWVMWSYGEKIHWFGGESHTLGTGFLNGPYLIVGNWFECGSACYFSGGGPIDQRGGPGSDALVAENLFMHDAMWRYLSAGGGRSPGPPFGCGPLDQIASHDNCPTNWVIKNNTEAKLGHRLVFVGNRVKDNWADGQSGYPNLQTVRTISGGPSAGIFNILTGEPLTAINHVRWESNWIEDCPVAFQISTRSLRPGDGGGVSQPITNMDYINNVVSNCRDTAQWGNVNNDLFAWAGSGANTYVCNMTRDGGGTAHAACAAPKLANYAASGTLPTGDPTIVDNAFDISSVTKGTVGGVPHTVTIKINTQERHDPMVGGSATIGNTAGWNGTFTVTGVYNTGSNTVCQNVQVPQNQPCIRPDGTFGDSFTYVDNVNVGTSDGTLCSTKATCENVSGINVQVIMPTLSYKVLDMAVGDNIYTHDCTDSTFNAGQDAAHVANALTDSRASLNVDFANAGAVVLAGAGVQCVMENNSGFPRSTTFQYNTVIALESFNFGVAGKFKQVNNNKFYHNLFIQPSASTGAFITCNGVAGEGTAPLSQCWQQSNLEFWDNVLVGRSSGNWSVFPGGSPANAFPATPDCNLVPTSACVGFSGFMTTGSFPTTACSYASNGHDPFNCPLMSLPWKNNFTLSKLTPVFGSSYANEGANIPALESQFTASIYQCPIGADCGPHGPYPYFGGSPPPPGATHTIKGAVIQKGAINPR